MLLFKKLVDETQMPKPQKYTDTFILTKKLFLVGLRGLQSISNPVERPCNSSDLIKPKDFETFGVHYSMRLSKASIIFKVAEYNVCNLHHV